VIFPFEPVGIADARAQSLSNYLNQCLFWEIYMVPAIKYKLFLVAHRSKKAGDSSSEAVIVYIST
jgi:hypothetical protein